MSISVEPEPALAPSPARPVQPAPSSSTYVYSPLKLKPRGRVSKGPKKREGKGWIIGLCTTSGALSQAEAEPEHESGEVGEQSIELDVFGGDSDLTDIDTDQDTPEPEYDLRLAGLPPVPFSPDEE
jgi:hypothetical protein